MKPKTDPVVKTGSVKPNVESEKAQSEKVLAGKELLYYASFLSKILTENPAGPETQKKHVQVNQGA